jgi:hypothetical protein
LRSRILVDILSILNTSNLNKSLHESRWMQISVSEDARTFDIQTRPVHSGLRGQR